MALHPMTTGTSLGQKPPRGARLDSPASNPLASCSGLLCRPSLLSLGPQGLEPPSPARHGRTLGPPETTAQTCSPEVLWALGLGRDPEGLAGSPRARVPIRVSPKAAADAP